MVGAAARRAPGAALSAAEPVFRRAGDLLVPTAHARGPWDPEALHGGAPAALIAQALHDPDQPITRITYDFLAAVPLAPLRLEVRVTRPGRRLRVVEAALSADGRVVVQARATGLRRGAVTLPAGPDAHAVPGGPPERARPSPFPLAETQAESFHRTAMEIRFGGDTSYGRGPALAWFRFARPLVDATPARPIALVAAAADFGNGVARVLDYETHLFPNTDMTIHVHREPAGEWVMLDARTCVQPDGAGLAAATLHDEHGPIGVAAQTLYVSDR